jgi:hypothetical protein
MWVPSPGVTPGENDTGVAYRGGMAEQVQISAALFQRGLIIGGNVRGEQLTPDQCEFETSVR